MKGSLIVICGLLTVQTAHSYEYFDFSHVKNVTLSSSDSVERNVERACDCRVKCFVQPKCMAFTLVYRNNESWCDYFTKGISPKHRYIQQEGALLGYRSAPPGKLESDGLFYFTLDEIQLSFEKAKLKCESFPGYRLALIKTVASKDIAFKYCKNCPTGYPFTVIDMYKGFDGNIYHGDGTLVSDELKTRDMMNVNTGMTATIFMLYDNRFDDQFTARGYFPLCQGNILDIIY